MNKETASESEKSDKGDKSDKHNKAFFIQRLIAYLIDIFFVSFIVSVFVGSFVDIDALSKLQDSLLEVSTKAQNFEIGIKTFINESIPLTYKIARVSGILTFATLFLNIVYFIIFQLKNDGQTLGKKIMKIKVASTDGELTSNQLLLRSLIVNEILVGMVGFGLMIFTKEDIYYYGTLIFSMIQYLIVFISSLLIIFTKSHRGLHDLISHTEVIKVR